MKKPFTTLALAALATLGSLAPLAAQAQEITLKVHHFLPPGSPTQSMILQPWCEQIAADSGGKLKCQIYPSMQLGGTPPQLIEQVRDGVVDVVWTLPGYSAGRFPSLEAFELPFTMHNPEATSKALWDYTRQYSAQEFKDVHPLAFHVHGDGVFHMMSKPIRTMADLRGLKLRAPTRMTNKFIAMLGGTPVSMPVPQVADALSKGVIDGAVVPYEVVPSLKIHEIVKFHSETDPKEAAFYTSTFVMAMNKAKYESLPPDLKKVIDKHSGQSLSAAAGRAFMQADLIGKKLTAKNTTNVIPASELAVWKKLGDKLAADWVNDMNGKGAPGQQMLDSARGLIAKYGAAK